MNSKSLPIIIGLILVVLVGGLVYMQSQQSSAPAASQTQTTQTDSGAQTDTTQTSGQTYTMAEVATHNGAQSCWTAVDGGVYDVTNWINQHPGGSEAILSLCGSDGTEAFRAQHNSAPKQENILASFKIGTLAQ